MSSVTPEQLVAFLRSQWTEIAMGAYEGFLAVGRGCLTFPKGLIQPEGFGLISAGYIKRDDFEHYFASVIPEGEGKAIMHYIDTYDPETTLVMFIPQEEGGSLLVLWGLPQGFPPPKDIWARRKAEPGIDH